MRGFTKFCLFIYLSLLIPKNFLVSCSDAQAGSTWQAGANHVDVDLNKKESTNEIDYEKKAEAHVYTTKDGFFVSQVVVSGVDTDGKAKTNLITKPNNNDARRVILYTITGKGPQLEVIYAADLATNNAKFQRYVNAGANYGPDAEPPAAPATPASTPAEPAQATTPPAAPATPASTPAEPAQATTPPAAPATPASTPAEPAQATTPPAAPATPASTPAEPAQATTPPAAPATPASTPAEPAQATTPPAAPATPASTPAEPAQATTPPAAPAQEAQPVAETAPMAQAAPTHTAPVAEQTESDSDSAQTWAAPAPQDASAHVATPVAHVAPDATQPEASPALAGPLGGSPVAPGSVPNGTLQVDPTTGRSYADFTIEEDENEGGQSSGTTVEVQEIHGAGSNTVDYDSDEDDYQVQRGAPNLTAYVHSLGHRVSDLEYRMEASEERVSFLTKIVQYQHELMEVNQLFKGKGGFEAAVAHGMASTAFMGGRAPLFRPATHEGVRELDHSEFPADLKLYVADANAANGLAELGHDKLTVKAEHNEVMYQLAEGVQLVWVTLLDKTVWFHRENDPHPLAVVFYPADAKVVLDFADAILMYVRKPENQEAHEPNAAHTEDMNLSHTDAGADAHADAHGEDAGLAAPAHGAQEAGAAHAPASPVYP